MSEQPLVLMQLLTPYVPSLCPYSAEWTRTMGLTRSPGKLDKAAACAAP